MEAVSIDCQFRTPAKKGGARKIRRAGHVPAVLYGMEGKSVSIRVAPSAIKSLLRTPRSTNTVVELVHPDSGLRQLAMIMDMQREPVSKAILHVDFRRVEKDEMVIVTVPVERVGRSVGEAVGGAFEQPSRTMQVRCTPFDVPARIEYDVSALDVGSRVFVDDIDLPEGVESVYQQRFVVFQIVEGRGAALDEEAAEEAEGEATEEAAPEQGEEA
jgi:large subunit ribosomal protein L25